MKEDDDKLNYLIQHCKDAAKDAVENCLMLPPENGYQEAKEILRKNFGQKHTVVRARSSTRLSTDLKSAHGSLSFLNWPVT